MTRPLPRPKAVLFDLFHTLASVSPPRPERGERSVGEILGVCGDEWARRYHDDDVLGRCVGRVRDAVDAMRRVARSIDPTVPDERIAQAVASRRRRFEEGLVDIEPAVLTALDRLRAAGVKTALVSDAGHDDVEAWARSPLVSRLDAVAFSYELGVRKPDRRIYEHALAAIGVDAREALFVGDGGSDEHRGARALGMGAVLVTRFYAAWRPTEIAARRPHADWEFADVAAFVEALAP
jgi:putative hydrolase of the HAD superfamily